MRTAGHPARWCPVVRLRRAAQPRQAAQRWPAARRRRSRGCRRRVLARVRVHRHQRQGGEQAQHGDPLGVAQDEGGEQQGHEGGVDGVEPAGRACASWLRRPTRSDDRREDQGGADAEVVVGQDEGGQRRPRRPRRRRGPGCRGRRRATCCRGRATWAAAGAAGRGAGGVRVLMTGPPWWDRRGVEGQLDARTQPRSAVGDRDGAAVQLGDPARDGQAEPGAAVVGRAGREPLEHGAAVGGRDARAVVGHGDADARPRRRSALTRTSPPAGLCRDALSSRLASSWCSRSGSAGTVSPAGSTRTA